MKVAASLSNGELRAEPVELYQVGGVGVKFHQLGGYLTDGHSAGLVNFAFLCRTANLMPVYDGQGNICF